MAEESVAREDVATLRTKYDTGRDFSPLKHCPHPVLSPSSHLLQLYLSCFISSQRREKAKTGTPAGRLDPYYSICISHQ